MSEPTREDSAGELGDNSKGLRRTRSTLFSRLLGGGSSKKEKEKEEISFASNSSTNELILREALKSEAETASKLRVDLQAQQNENKMQNRLLEKEIRKNQKLLKESETMKNLLSKSPENIKSTYSELEQLKKENEEQGAEIRRLRKALEDANATAAARTAELEAERAKNKAKVKQLLAERNTFEHKYLELTNRKMDTNFASKSADDITTECRAVFHRSLGLLACHADLPRLVRNMNFLDMEGNTVARASPDLPLALQIKDLLVKVAARLDGNELAQKISTGYKEFVDESGQRDLMKGLSNLLPGLIGEDSKLISLLKIANQSVIAPVVNYLNHGLEGVLPFNSAKNGWRIQVLFTADLVRITHMRREQANHDSEQMYGPFTFDWEIDFRLDKELSELVGMEVKLVAISAADSAKEESLRNVLGKAFKVFGTAAGEPLYRLPDVATTIAASSDSSKNSSGKRNMKEPGNAAVPLTRDSDSSRNNSGQKLKLGLNSATEQPASTAASGAYNSLRGKQKEELKRAATSPASISRTDTDKEVGVAFQESWAAPSSARGTPGSSRVHVEPLNSARSAAALETSPPSSPPPTLTTAAQAGGSSGASPVSSPKTPKPARSASHHHRKPSRPKDHSPRDGKEPKEKKDKTPRDKDKTPRDKDKSPRDKKEKKKLARDS